MFHYARSSLRGSVCNVLLEWPTGAGRPDCPLGATCLWCGLNSVLFCFLAMVAWIFAFSVADLLALWAPGLPLVLRAMRVGSDVSPCANSFVCVQCLGLFSLGDAVTAKVF